MFKLSAHGHPFQYAWHVPSIDAAVDYWSTVVGVGPFFVNDVDSDDYDGFRYRGQPGRLAMRVAWGQSKEGQIELIEVGSSEPNVYHDLVAPDRTAFHHVGIWSDDYRADRAALEAAGFELAMDLAPSNICYFDTSAENGAMLELIERNDAITGLFALIAQAAEGWDGSRPLRTLADLTAG